MIYVNNILGGLFALGFFLWPGVGAGFVSHWDL